MHLYAFVCIVLVSLSVVSGANVWYQLAFWPSDPSAPEPLYEVQWPPAGTSLLHQIQAPVDMPWSAQFTVAQTVGDDLNLPAAVLSLEIRQLSALHYVIVVEVTNEYNAEAVATYIDELVNSNGVIYNYLIHHATESSPASEKFARLPLELIDFWRLDLRVDPIIASQTETNTSVLISHIIGSDLLPYSFFEPSLLQKGHSVVMDWLLDKQQVWTRHVLEPHSTLKYLRLVGEYALYSEVMTSPAETGENGRSSIAFFAKDDTEAEMEIVLGSWVSDAILQGRLLHISAENRRTLDISSPVSWSSSLDTVMERHAYKHGFHRELVTNLQLPYISSLDSSATNSSDVATAQKCSLLFIEFFPESLYLDMDEIKRLSRFGGPDVYPFGVMDIEKPASLSRQTAVLVRQNISSSLFASRDPKQRWFNLSLPIHLRYHKAAFGASYVNIELPPPFVFFKCQNPGVESSCPRTGTIWPQPFLVESKLVGQCPGWKRLPLRFKPEIESAIVQTNRGYTRRRQYGILVLPMPIGKLEHQMFVAIVTFLSTSLGALLLLVSIFRVKQIDSDKLKTA